MRAFALFVVLSWSTMSAPAWAQHHPEMPDMNHGGHSDPSLQPSEAPQDDVEEGPMDHGSMTTTPTLEVVGDDPAPDPPLDHAADSVFDPAVMEHARDQLSREHGRSLITKVMLNLAEFRVQDAGTSGYRWEGEGRVQSFMLSIRERSRRFSICRSAFVKISNPRPAERTHMWLSKGSHPTGSMCKGRSSCPTTATYSPGPRHPTIFGCFRESSCNPRPR